MEENKKYSFKSLLSYVSHLKKSWNIMVFDPKSKKKAVADTLPEAVKKLKRDDGVSDELIVIDQKTAGQLSEEQDKEQETKSK